MKELQQTIDQLHWLKEIADTTTELTNQQSDESEEQSDIENKDIFTGYVYSAKANENQSQNI